MDNAGSKDNVPAWVRRVPLSVWTLVLSVVALLLMRMVYVWVSGAESASPALLVLGGGFVLLAMSSVLDCMLLMQSWLVKDSTPMELWPALQRLLGRNLERIRLGVTVVLMAPPIGICLWLEVFTREGRESLYLLPMSSVIIFFFAMLLVWRARQYPVRAKRVWVLTGLSAVIAFGAAVNFGVGIADSESRLSVVAPALAGALAAVAPAWVCVWVASPRIGAG